MFMSYLSFFTFLACIIMGIIGISLEPKAKLNRAFGLYVLIISFWSFGDIFYNLAKNENVAWFWNKVTAVGWCGMIFAIIYLCLIYSDYYKKTPLFIKF